jgi:hypothetical protein
MATLSTPVVASRQPPTPVGALLAEAAQSGPTPDTAPRAPAAEAETNP